jgi:hypothetical protein
MRHYVLVSLTITGALLLAATGHAQSNRRIIIDQVRVGFPAMAEPGEPVDPQNRMTLYKAGFWTPVYVDLTATKEVPAGVVVVESTDSDDVQNHYTVPLPRGGIPAGEPVQLLAYTKPGSATDEITVTVELPDGTKAARFTSSFNALGAGDVLILAVGSRLQGLRSALSDQNKQASQNNAVLIDESRFAFVDDVRMLPTRWFGYAGIDLLVLTTGSRDFVESLLHDRDHRQEALGEWVRRGGRLVVSCGRNQDMLPELLARMQLDLPVDFKGPLQLEHLEAVESWVPGNPPTLANAAPVGNPNQKPPAITAAKLEARPGLEWMAPEDKTERVPLLMMRAAQGLGQVVLVAFDVDQPPFNTWKSQADFWKKLQSKVRAKPQVVAGQSVRYSGGWGNDAGDKDLASELEKGLEQFQDVSVISFGWVALFIFIYILIVGPLDYLFLKKVVKRLELTWITFPTVVLVVSAAAYFAAYALKGNDLKINKKDLVDIDLQSGQAYGTTWFTLFSPRIQLYTIGVQPAPGWFVAGGDKESSSATVSWMGRPEMGYGGFNRPRSQGLFRRTYDYAADAVGLKGVPIQVWSTKSFTASWERPYNPAQPPVTANLHRRPTVGLEGTLTSNLPAALEEASLVYSDGTVNPKFSVCSLGSLEPGVARPITGQEGGQAIGSWKWERERPMNEIMFHDMIASQSGSRDSPLRYLDQSWRPGHKTEVMLVGRLAGAARGPAEAVTADPGTPSRVWLGELPGPGTSRPQLQGTLDQRTYIRVYIPLQEARPTP